MDTFCLRCGGKMDEGRIPSPLKYFFGYKSTEQKHFSFETNVEKAKVCLECGHLELFVDPDVLKSKMKE